MIQFTKWCMSVHPFSLTCNLDLLLLLCFPLPFVKEVKASLTGVQERAPLVAVGEARKGARVAAHFLQAKARVPIALLAKSGWLASVNVLCACFGIRESATWRTASMSICVVWQPMASLAWVIIVLTERKATFH